MRASMRGSKLDLAFSGPGYGGRSLSPSLMSSMKSGQNVASTDFIHEARFMKQALIIGASGGLGGALAHLLLDRGGWQVLGTYHQTEPLWQHSLMTWRALNIRVETEIASLMTQLPKIDLLINTTGILTSPYHGPEKSIRQFNAEHMMMSFEINTAPILNLAKHAQTALKASNQPIIVALSARVGSIADNDLGGWYSYRCAKAALNMAVKTLAIEWQRSLPMATLIAYHPGTVRTALSAPFLKSGSTSVMLSPGEAAEHCLQLLDTLTPANTGSFWDWRGQKIPW